MPAHLSGIQFRVTNVAKEIDMTPWYGLSRKEATQLPPASPPILHPTAGLAGQLVGLQGQAGSGSTLCIIPNAAFAFPVPPLPRASGIPAAHSGSIL